MPTEWWNSAESWLTAHDLTIDLLTVWILVVGFYTLASVNLITVWTLRHQHDETEVGKAIKGKKAAEAGMCAGMGTLYALSLYAYYAEYAFGPIARFGIRVVVAAGITIAAVFGVRFIRALAGENWGKA